jgi:hypothetical protein
VQTKSPHIEAFHLEEKVSLGISPRTFSERCCKVMWISNVAAGIFFAIMGGLLSCVTFGYNFRVNLFGLTMNAFLAGLLAVFVGGSVAVCSIWRIR